MSEERTRFLSFLLAYAHAQASGKTPNDPEDMLMKQAEFLSTQMIKTKADDEEQEEGKERGTTRVLRARATNPISNLARLGV